MLGHEMKQKKGTDNGNADLFSHLPLPEVLIQIPELGDTVLVLETLEETPVTATQIRVWTDRDKTLSKVL